jgi:3-oxoacyl-[acyl-carrier protein] reductase
MPGTREEKLNMLANDSLKGQVALITGSGQPFADAVARRFSELGAKLALIHDASDAEAAAAFVAPEGTLKLECNGSDPKAVKATVRTVAAELGGVGILICASLAKASRPLLEMSAEQWKEAVDAQLSSTVYFDREVIRPMMKAKQGRIINVLFSLTGAAGAVLAHGIASLTRALASELATHGIFVNSLAVGELEELGKTLDEDSSKALSILARGVSPLGRPGRASEAAEVAAFLASSIGGLSSGTTLSASGGVYP